MILNILIIIFIVIMAAVWSRQGLFSSFLHLLLVVVSGTLAIALWEPLVLGLLIKYIPMYAWGIGLLVMFGVTLLVLRLAMDKLVPMNMQFDNMVNLLGGSTCGVATAILTAGIVLIGLGFLPLPADILGYQPYSVNGYGMVERTSQNLWIPVDNMATRFFTMLSRRRGFGGGSFNTSEPLGQYLPNMAEQAALFRMRYDPNASVIAEPDSVKVTDIYSHASAELQLPPAITDSFGPTFSQPDSKLVAIDTEWQKNKSGSTYDSDKTLRLPPTQIRLLAKSKQTGKISMLAPVAFSQIVDQTKGQRNLSLINTGSVSAYGTSSVKETFAWFFMMPDDLQPTYLFARRLRLTLPLQRMITDTFGIKSLLTIPAAEQDQDAGLSPGTVGEREGVLTGHQAQFVEITNLLPAEINKNSAAGLKFNENVVISGKALAKKSARRGSSKVLANQIHSPSHKAMIRVKIVSEHAKSVFGGAKAMAASLQGIWLKDSNGNMWYPHAYAVLQSNGDQEIYVDSDVYIRSASQLPVQKMGNEDILYLYFMVDRGIELVSYDVGNTTVQEINMKVPD